MSAVLSLWHKQMMKLSVHKQEAVGILFQPILWIVLFGTGMKGVFGAAMPGGDDLYITFMVPGIIALTAMSGAIQGGLVLLEERLRGFIKEYLAAPIPRISILIGNVLSTVTKSLIQVIIIIAIGALMGAKFGLNPLGWLGGLVLVAIFGLAFSGIGLAVASRTGSTGGYHMLIFMLTLPLLFVSNALYPLASLPTWMQILSRINPVSYMVDGLRQMVFESGATLAGGDLLPLWLCFVVVAAYAIFGILLASVSFKKSIR